MSSAEHLTILRQGVEVWNKWREVDKQIMPDLSGVALREYGVHDSVSRLSNLRGINFRSANLQGAVLNAMDLSGCNLHGASLSGATMRESQLERATVTEADLSHADLRKSVLSDTDLRGSGLIVANLGEVILRGVNFADVWLGKTTFVGNDLSETTGLDSANHSGPSFVGIDTIHLSRGQIPEAFLRGCGLTDVDIEFSRFANPQLSNAEITAIAYRINELRATRPVQINPLFISYSTKDGEFVDKMEGYLDRNGIRFWRDIHDAVAGRLETQIDRAMRLNPTVLLVLSHNSVESDWVEHEVRLARQIEKETKCDVFCPLALDDTWKRSNWPKRLMEQITEYNILDFSNWQEDKSFDKQFQKLIKGLHIFYGAIQASSICNLEGVLVRQN